MDSLPTEVLGLILLWNVRMCRCDKNALLPLRLVCKAFDDALKPYVFKAVQLEFSKFHRHEPTPDISSLARVGNTCEALYLDMMVVRDEEEISRLSNVFQGLIPKVPEMVPLLDSLRRYCMNESTFDETDFRRVLESVLEATPNMRRLKLNLPFQVVGQQSRTATLLLATTLSCLTKRPEEYRPIETLVLDHVSDTTFSDICNNPMDLSYAIKTFAQLKNLVLSIKRQEARNSKQITFTQNLWFLIRKAVNLDSLCLIGWNVKRDINTRRYSHGVSFNVWNMRSLPFSNDQSQRLKNLRFLELKRVDIDPFALLGLVRECASSLKEIYLNEVYMKVRADLDGSNMLLWIGQAGTAKPDHSCWLAQELHDMEDLKLDVLRATGLGYDDFHPNRDAINDFDLVDPTSRNRNFDQRFVEAVLGSEDLIILDASMDNSESMPLDSSATASESAIVPVSTVSTWPGERISGPLVLEIGQERPADLASIDYLTKQKEYDAETFQRYHNTTSHFKRCIDGYFFNHNEQALKELQKIITVADRGMNLLSAEIDRARYGNMIAAEGELTQASVAGLFPPSLQHVGQTGDTAGTAGNPTLPSVDS